MPLDSAPVELVGLASAVEPLLSHSLCCLPSGALPRAWQAVLAVSDGPLKAPVASEGH